MYIRFAAHPHLQRYHNDEYMDSDYRITEISEAGVAQVRSEVGERLIEAFDHIEEYESDNE
jgi:hypothetical protein